MPPGSAQPTVRLALALWWRYTWRSYLRILAGFVLLLLAAAVITATIGFAIGALPWHHGVAGHATPHSPQVRALIFWGSVLAGWAAITLWQTTHVLARSVFGPQCGRRIMATLVQDDAPIPSPLPWKAAMAVLWALSWRGTILSLLLRGLFAIPGDALPLHAIWPYVSSTAGSALAFWWLLARQYGAIKIRIEENRG